MVEADVLRGGQRVPIDSTGEVGALEQAYNTMMQRLETERREAGARTLMRRNKSGSGSRAASTTRSGKR